MMCCCTCLGTAIVEPHCVTLYQNIDSAVELIIDILIVCWACIRLRHLRCLFILLYLMPLLASLIVYAFHRAYSSSSIQSTCSSRAAFNRMNFFHLRRIVLLLAPTRILMLRLDMFICVAYGRTSNWISHILRRHGVLQHFIHEL
jgi:hypothetical protein